MADYSQRMARRIRSERQRLGLSEAELAAEVGVRSDKTIRRWESGKSEPQPRNLRALAQRFDIKVIELRPDMEAEERAVLAQLDRIEKMLEDLVKQAGLKPPPAKKGGLPKTPIRRRTGRPKKQQGA